MLSRRQRPQGVYGEGHFDWINFPLVGGTVSHEEERGLRFERVTDLFR